MATLPTWTACAAVAGVDVVYHAAGQTKSLHAAEMYRINVGGTANVAQACAEQPRPPVLILVSSLAAAGPTGLGRPRVESDRPVQVSEYGRSKRAAELAAQRVADRVGVTVVRPPIVLGQRDIVGLEMFRSIAHTGVHLCPGLSRRRFSLIHAADLAQLLILAAERGWRLPPLGQDQGSPGKGVYFAACEEDSAYADLGRMIGKVLERRRVITLQVAWPLVWLFAAVGELTGQLLRRPVYLNLDKAWEVTTGSWLCSPRAAIQDLGFSVGAPLAERLVQTVQWYRDAAWL